MNKSLNITFFGFAPLAYGGGYEFIIMKMAEKLSEDGHNINIVTGDQIMSNIFSMLFYNKLSERRMSKNNINKNLPLVKIYEYESYSLLPVSKSFNNIRRIMRKSDIIYTRNEIIDFLFINYFCGKYRPPIICGIHTSIIYLYTKTFVSKLHNMVYKKYIYGKLLNNCSKILAQNKFDMELLLKYNVNKDKIIKILPFIDDHLFCHRDIKRTNNKFKILFAGRLTEQKGIDTLYNAIENMTTLKEFSDMTFTIAGSGELGYMIDELMKKYDNIEFLGFVSQNKLIELYNSHDVVVLPSRWETTLKVVLEAQACGLPVIVSNIPGPDELVINGKTGFLIEPEDYKGLSESILKTFWLKKCHMEKYICMKNACIKNIEKYSSDIVISKLENLFHDSVKDNTYER